MIHSLPRALVLLAVSLVMVPNVAFAQASSVDQVLGAIAEVIRDRAKQVASQTVANKLKSNLCSGTLDVPRKAEEGGGKLTLNLGGSDDCKSTYLLPEPGQEPKKAVCTPDDVFVRTCRAAIRMETPLNDPYLLKSLSLDTVDFLMRVSARSLNKDKYVESGLVEIGAFVHAALEQLSGQKKGPGDLAQPLLDLADRLEKGEFAVRLFTELEAADETKALQAGLKGVVDGWVKTDKCSPFADSANPGAGCQAAWYDTTCTPNAARDAARDAVFESLFGAGGELADGRNKACKAAYPGNAAKQSACWKARLTHNLHGVLARGACLAQNPSPDPFESRKVFRELTYVVDELAVYREAMEGLGVATKPLDEFAIAVQRVRLTALPRAELGAGIRFLGAYAAALGESPERTHEWVRALRTELDAAVQTHTLAAFEALLRGNALGTAGPFRGSTFGTLRGATKDLLTITAFPFLRASAAFPRGDTDLQASLKAAEALQDAATELLGALKEGKADAATASELLVRVGGFIDQLAKVAEVREKVTTALEKRDKGKRDAASADFKRFASSMKAGSEVLALAAKRDWVGLALRIEDELARVAAKGKVVELERSLRFVKVLLSMYQAESTDEAKAIFSAALEEASSRERRFDGLWTFDVAALFGLQGGAGYVREGTFGTNHVTNSTLAGLAAPVGVQVGIGHLGVLVYPLDLGSYLTAPLSTGGADEAKAGKVAWQSALRFGAAAYWRIWADVPVILGVAADVSPRIEKNVEFRWYATLALELPLFVIH